MKKQILEQMITLSTAGFGLVAALAWNQVIQELVQQVIKPVLGENSGLISLLIYAVVITIVATIITYYSAKFGKKD